MPSKSESQRKFMLAAAHNSAFAKKANIPQSVAKDFVKADEKKASQKNMIKKRYGYK